MKTFIVNRRRLRPISTFEAWRLPDGAGVIIEHPLMEPRTFRVLKRTYYRAVIETRRTVGGPDQAIRSEPDATWPQIPVWQMGWLWLNGTGPFDTLFIDEGPASPWEAETWPAEVVT